LAAAGTAGVVVVAVSAAESTKPAATAATAASALLGMDFHCGAEKQGQNAAEIFFETACFHNFPFH
jgi:hypothetical protein